MFVFESHLSKIFWTWSDFKNSEGSSLRDRVHLMISTEKLIALFELRVFLLFRIKGDNDRLILHLW